MEDWYKITLNTNQGVFIYVVMSFDVKNIPQIYQCNFNKPFQEYINMFMKIFLDDYIFVTLLIFTQPLLKVKKLLNL